MPRLNLKTYLQEVSTLIANEARDEAIGHCKHILQTFPKHLQTYRFLGQALFEREQFAAAVDVFRRILAAVPDDRDAHLYLCEIYTGEQNYDAAIFHLERVWEQAPEDPDIQDELKKLYAKRDGEAPPALQLTAPALARRYFNGRLYAEAAAELYAILERQPERHDLRGLLAQTLWLDDRPEEATEVALQLLAALPDHLIANRIMAELWLLMERPSDARPFVARLQALDPYLAWQIVRAEDAPEDAFMLERLDWRAKSAALALDVSGMGEIFSSLDSISLSESSAPAFDQPPKPLGGRLAQRATGALSDWSTQETPAQPAFVMPDWSDFEAESAQEDLPDWLADETPLAAAPAQTESAATDEDFDFSLFETSAPSAPPSADVPDWLADETPLAAAPAQTESAATDEDFDFSFFETSGAPDLITAQSEAVAEGEAEVALDLDWLSGAPDEVTAEAEPSEAVAEGEVTSTFDLDWLSGASDEVMAEAEPPVALDWMIEDSTAFEPPPAAESISPHLRTDEFAAIQADPLGWMSEFGLSAVPEPETPEVELDESDLAELAAQLAATGNFESPADQPTEQTAEPQSMAQIAEQMSADTMLEWLQQNAPTPEFLEAAASEALTIEPSDATAADAALSPDSIPLEDEWLAAFEPEATPSLPLSPVSEGTDWAEAGDDLFGSAESPDWLIGSPEALSEAEELADEAERSFDALLEQARRAANAPRPIGDTGILSPDSLPDWLSAFDESAPAPAQVAEQTTSEQTDQTPDLSMEALFGEPSAAALTDQAPAWLTESAEPSAAPPELSIEALFGEPSVAEPLAPSPDLPDTTDVQSRTAQADAEDEPITFTFRKPPPWQRKRSSKAD